MIAAVQMVRFWERGQSLLMTGVGSTPAGKKRPHSSLPGRVSDFLLAAVAPAASHCLSWGASGFEKCLVAA